MSLVGKYFIMLGKEYCHSGRIDAQVSDTHVLVEVEKCEHVPRSLLLLPITAFTTTVAPDGSFDCSCEIFNSREEMEAFEEWLSTPDEASPAAAGTVLN